MDLLELRAAFERRFGRTSSAIVRAPGRVNLIGEHTDYSNLPVLPIAMNRSTLVAVAATDDDTITACSERFAGEARLRRAAPEPDPLAPWQRYVVGVLTQLEGTAVGRGAELCIGGDLPPTGGLSSSSALTMGLLAALSEVWQLGLDLDRLVQLGIVAERHVGVESGGMDQTIIALAQRGTALRIEFAPPRRRAVPLPAALRIVVAYSGEEAPKGGSVRQAYNERVVGCRLAAALLASRLGRPIDRPPLLGQVAPLVAGDSPLLDSLPETTSPEAVARALGLDLEPLVRLTATRFDPAARVSVRPFARHVLTEARRVDLAEAALREGALERFGALLDASHHSLAVDFRCSSDQLDRLCEAMRGAGAHGARLTGAGFGGYAVAGVPAQRVDAVLEAARQATGGPALETPATAGLEVLR